MDITEIYKKLKKKIEEKSWAERFKSIQLSLFIFSIFGHLACIGTAHIFLHSIITETEPDTPEWLAILISIFLLAVFELIKRSVLYRWSEDFVIPEKRKSSYPLFVASFLIMIASFFFTLNGIKRFTDKEYEAYQIAERQRVAVTDSINRVYSSRIEQLNKRLRVTDSLKTALEMKSANNALFDEGKNTKQVSKLSDKFSQEIDKILSEIKYQKDMAKKEIEENMVIINNRLNEQTNRSKNNSIYFVIILVVTELVILFGIWFHSYYEWKSIEEMEEKINKNENLKNYLLWNDVIDILYCSGIKTLNVGDPAPNVKDLLELCRSSGIYISEQEIKEKFFRLISALGILETRGSKRYIKQPLKTAKELLKKQFKR